MHQKPRIPPRPKEDGVSCCMMDETPFELEFTWNRGFDGVYENAGKDVHIAFRVPDFEAAHKLHEEMGCIVRENPAMGLYFIADPDGQWIEILPEI